MFARKSSTILLSTSRRVANKFANKLAQAPSRNFAFKQFSRNTSAIESKTFNKNITLRNYASYPAGIFEVAMPALSPTMEKGNLVQWKVKVGDKVTAGDVFCSVETDKATLDFEVQQEGFIAKILVDAGTKDLAVGSPVLLMASKKDDIAKAANIEVGQAPAAQAAPAATPAPAQAAPVQQQAAPVATPVSQAAPVAAGDRIFASPLAKKTATEKNVNLASIGVGSGPNNRILKADVDAFASKPQAAILSAPSPAASKAAPAAAAAADFVDIPVSNIRGVIAQRLLESKRNIPHYYLTVECQLDALLKVRNQLNKIGEANKTFKLSVNDFLIKASANALKKVPEVNSSWQGDFIRQYKTADVSVAVQTDNGLITPIVFGAEKRGLADISNSVKDLAKKARDGKLQPQEFQGGTFTISNLGMFGISEFSAIINPPQACIMAVGAAEKKVVPNEDPATAKDQPFKVVTVMKVTLSCDHRVVDGAVGAQWLQAFKDNIENPLMLML